MAPGVDGPETGGLAPVAAARNASAFHPTADDKKRHRRCSLCWGGSAVRLYARSGQGLSRVKPSTESKLQTTAVSDRGLAAGVTKDGRSILFWGVPRWADS